jgi:hypothetical protein
LTRTHSQHGERPSTATCRVLGAPSGARFVYFLHVFFSWFLDFAFFFLGSLGKNLFFYLFGFSRVKSTGVLHGEAQLCFHVNHRCV